MVCEFCHGSVDVLGLLGGGVELFCCCVLRICCVPACLLGYV